MTVKSVCGVNCWSERLSDALSLSVCCARWSCAVMSRYILPSKKSAFIPGRSVVLKIDVSCMRE